MCREDLVLPELRLNAEPSRGRREPFRCLPLRMSSADPAQQCDTSEQDYEPGLELPDRPGQRRRDQRGAGEQSEHTSAESILGQPAPLGVGHDLVREPAPPAGGLAGGPCGQRLRGHHTVSCSGDQVVEDALLVRVQGLVDVRSEANVEDPGPRCSTSTTFRAARSMSVAEQPRPSPGSH